jgi:oligogalacturonide lyase
MIGQKWNAEVREFKDEKTGCPIKQLTTTGNNYHLYFSEDSFDANRNEIFFLSDHASGEDKAPHEGPVFNLFHMDLDTGEMVQLTNETEPVRNVTKTPDSWIVAYISGHIVKKLDPQTGTISVLYEETGNYRLEALSIAHNRRYVGFCRDEKIDLSRGPNYAGFKEHYYRIKDERITLAYLDESGWFDAFKDTHWIKHFQFCPDDSTLAMFCHEGPWNLVTQRIWLFDLVSREARPCFRQNEQDSVGHEFWTQDGYIFFDNRGPGHDGTITSERTQAVATHVAIRQQDEMVPFVGLIDCYGKLVKRIDMPFYCNHYHANPDNTILVGDDVDDLVLIDISGEEATLEVLCHHKTSWHTSNSHCYPTWSWDGSRILYASDFGGRIQLYLIEL